MSAIQKVPVNAFMRFCHDERPRIKAEHPSFTLAEISHELGVRYNALSADERAKYKQMAIRNDDASAAQSTGTMATAIDFIDLVKTRLSSDAFDEFLSTLQRFKSKHIDVRTVTERVAKLFAGHRDLLLGFNQFLPTDRRIEPHMIDSNGRLKRGALDDNDAAPAADGDALRQVESVFAMASTSDGDSARDYIDSVKKRFDSHTFKQFLAILREFRDDERSRDDVNARIATLFAGHPDLIRDFNAFLRKHGKSAATPLNAADNNSLAVPKSGADADNAGDAATARRRRRPRSEQMLVVPTLEPSADEARAYLQRIRATFSVESRVFDKFIELLHGYQQQERSARDFFDKVSALFAKQADLVDDLMVFFPSNVALLADAVAYIGVPSPQPQLPPPSSQSGSLTRPKLRSPRTTSNGSDDDKEPKRAGTLTKPHRRESTDDERRARTMRAAAKKESPSKEKEKNSPANRRLRHERPATSPPLDVTPKSSPSKPEKANGANESRS